MTPAHKAANKGQEGCLRLLAEHGVDLTARDNNGWTPAHLAAKEGHAEVLTIHSDSQ